MNASHADRNLLFGILALQMDFISRDALVAAMNAWGLNKSQPLSQVLVDECQPSPESYQYRYVAKWVSKMHLGRVWLGAFARRSHDIISTTGCAVHRAPLEAIGDALRELLNLKRRGIIQATHFTWEITITPRSWAGELLRLHFNRHGVLPLYNRPASALQRLQSEATGPSLP